MATLMQRPEVDGEPAETVGDDKAMEQAEGSVRQKQNPRVLLAVAALLTGLSIAVPAAIIMFVLPLNHAEFYYANGYWHGEVWWSYVFTGMALSIGFGLAGIVLVIRSEIAAYRAAEASNGKTARSVGTPARVALSFALLDLILGPIAFIALSNLAGMVVTMAFGLTGLLLATRSEATADGVAEGQRAKTYRSWTTRAKVALSLALVILVFGSVVLGGAAILTGIAISIGFGVAGIVLSIRSATAAYRAAEASNGKTARSVGTPARVALSFALVVLPVGSVVYMVTTAMTISGFAIGPWIGLSLLGAGLVGIVVVVRPLTTAASLVLPFALAGLILGPWASSPSNDGSIGRSLIGAGLVGIAVAVWGVSGSDPAVTRRWLLPFAIVAFVLALLGNAHMFLLFGLQGLHL